MSKPTSKVTPLRRAPQAPGPAYRRQDEQAAMACLGQIIAEKLRRELDGARTRAQRIDTLRGFAKLMEFCYGLSDGRQAYLFSVTYAAYHGNVITADA